MGKLTLQEIAKVLVEKNGLTQREANRFASDFFANIQHNLELGEQVKVKGLGTFKIIGVEARESISVRTGERVVIDSHSKVSFTPDNTMKELVNKPFSQFETVVLNEGVVFEDEKDDDSEDDAESFENVVAEQPTEPEPEPHESEPKLDKFTESDQEIEPDKSTEPEILDVFEEEIIEEMVDDKTDDKTDEKTDEKTEDEKVDEKIDETVEDKEEEKSEEETEEIADAQEDVIESEAADEVSDKEENTSWGRWLLGGLGILALMALSAFGGYYYGSMKQTTTPDSVFVHDTVFVPELTSPAVVDSVVVDSVPSAPSEAPVSLQPSADDAASSEPSARKDEKTSALDPYSQKDPRVRYGAYRITGTAQVVTVKAGQTFLGICRMYLGPGLECYVEAYNDLPQQPKLKEGQVIKIPKLELKKKRRK